MADENIDVKITVDNKQANRALKKTEQVAEKTEKGIKDIGLAFPSVAVAATAAFAAIGGTIAKSVKSFGEFENGLLGVKTLLNESSFGAKGLEAGFADLEKETLKLVRTVPVSIDKINKALFDTVSAGVDAGQAVEVVGVSAKLAVAGLTDVSVATDGITSALNAYQINAEEADVVAAKFFAAQKAGKTTIEELSSSFGLAGSTAASLGVSIDELLGAVAAATTGGIATSSAFTGLKAVLANISKPTADATKEANRLGVEFNLTALRSKGLLGFLESIRNANGFTTDSITKLFGSVEAQGIAFSLTGAQAGAFAKNVSDLNNETKILKDSTEAYNTQAASQENKLTSLSNKFNALFIAIGQKLSPGLKDLAESAGVAVDAATGLFSDEPISQAEKYQRVIDKASASLNSYYKSQERLRDLQLDTTAVDANIEAEERKIEVAQKALFALNKANAAEQALEDARILREEEKKKREEEAAIAAAEKAALDEENRINELIKLGEFEKAKVLLQKKGDTQRLKDLASYIKQKEAAEQQSAALSISIQKSALQLGVALFKKGSKAAFIAQKAAAIASIIIDTQAAIAKAGQQLGAFAAPVQTKIAIQGGLSIATVAATALQGFADGGVVTGGIAGRDSVPIVAQRNELVAPTRSFDEVVEGVARQRGFVREDEEPNNNVAVSIDFGDNFREVFGDAVTSVINEKTALGV